MNFKKTIYHILTLKDLVFYTKDQNYSPANLEKDGFIHCSAEESTSLLVLQDYFAGVPETETILILEIDGNRLNAAVKFEPPAPVEGGGTTHLKEGILFPHIYGSLNMDAVKGAGTVERKNGKFIWPAAFEDVKKNLQK